MDRNQEYKDILAELENFPPVLDNLVTQSILKAKRRQKIKMAFYFPASSVATIFIAFVLLVNLSPGFAMAMEKIPVLRDLSAYVSFSPSLSTAVDNQYVQEIAQEKTQNGITMIIESVIVDKKQLNLFYSLKSDDYSAMQTMISIKGSKGEELSNAQTSSGGDDQPDGHLRQISIELIDEYMPEIVKLECDVYAVSESEIIKKGDKLNQFEDDMYMDVIVSLVEPGRIKTPESNLTESYIKDDGTEVELAEDEMLDIPKIEKVETFSFDLAIDSEYANAGKIITLNKDIILDGQNLTITTAEIYPTHSRVNFKDDENNTQWLQALTFYFINEKGERFDPIANGLTATGTEDSPMMNSHRLESPYFYESKNLTMYITDVVWREKPKGKITVDLQAGTAENLPEYLTLDKFERKDNSIELAFLADKYEDFYLNNYFELLVPTFVDELGKEGNIPLNSFQAAAENENNASINMLSIHFSLVNYPYDEVYFITAFCNETKLDIPIEINIK